MDAFLGVLGTIGLIVCLISLVKKKEKKKWGIGLGISLVALIVAFSINPSINDSNKTKKDDDNLKVEENTDDKQKTFSEKDEENETQKEEQSNDSSKNQNNANVIIDKSILEGNIGEGETIEEFSSKDNNLFIKVNLGEGNNSISKEDLAYSRFSSLTDELLKDDSWNNVNVEFVGVGKITMNKSQAVVNEFNLKHFKTEDIMKNFKK
ncbi:hypothetical protein CLPU_1c02740 [Gottschalkia purinilytica]|uniref:Uncharacterized protein n=1 Tax=Gottschalkia purinilytica TaxID=1503 RepID=A0A0L0WF62_GOTPU|nr:hypothetical protein [Gottschalkia purinilytica]KNF10109.1 hypothetical protein CLPU_1c02740 [Gottschalkia purinilytica]